MNESAKKAAYWLLKNVEKAIRDFEMIATGDRIAIGLSGGKDSLTLYSLMTMRNITNGAAPSILAIHILGDAQGTASEIHPPLRDWLEANHVDFHAAPLRLLPGDTLPLTCQRCTRLRRQSLFEAAQEYGCNVVALGHHADDLAETTLMNLLYYGKVETMLPRRDYFDGLIKVIRPLCYTPEKDIRRFARLMSFPEPPPRCQNSDHTRRKLAGELIKTAETGGQAVRVNLLRAGLKGTKAHSE